MKARACGIFGEDRLVRGPLDVKQNEGRGGIEDGRARQNVLST